ncbi:MAG TPA: hypothetical protein VGJ92_04225 [Methanocella sp.]
MAFDWPEVAVRFDGTGDGVVSVRFCPITGTGVTVPAVGVTLAKGITVGGGVRTGVGARVGSVVGEGERVGVEVGVATSDWFKVTVSQEFDPISTEIWLE